MKTYEVILTDGRKFDVDVEGDVPPTEADILPLIEQGQFKPAKARGREMAENVADRIGEFSYDVGKTAVDAFSHTLDSSMSKLGEAFNHPIETEADHPEFGRVVETFQPKTLHPLARLIKGVHGGLELPMAPVMAGFEGGKQAARWLGPLGEGMANTVDNAFMLGVKAKDKLLRPAFGLPSMEEQLALPPGHLNRTAAEFSDFLSMLIGPAVGHGIAKGAAKPMVKAPEVGPGYGFDLPGETPQAPKGPSSPVAPVKPEGPKAAPKFNLLNFDEFLTQLNNAKEVKDLDRIKAATTALGKVKSKETGQVMLSKEDAEQRLALVAAKRTSLASTVSPAQPPVPKVVAPPPVEPAAKPVGESLASSPAGTLEGKFPNIDTDSKAFIKDKVTKLGSVEAVEQAYPAVGGKLDNVSLYARELAKEQFEAKPATEVKAPVLSQEEVNKTATEILKQPEPPKPISSTIEELPPTPELKATAVKAPAAVEQPQTTPLPKLPPAKVEGEVGEVGGKPAPVSGSTLPTKPVVSKPIKDMTTEELFADLKARGYDPAVTKNPYPGQFKDPKVSDLLQEVWRRSLEEDVSKKPEVKPAKPLPARRLPPAEKKKLETETEIDAAKQLDPIVSLKDALDAVISEAPSPQAKTYAKAALRAALEHGKEGLYTQVLYILSNLSTWKGVRARQAKAAFLDVLEQAHYDDKYVKNYRKQLQRQAEFAEKAKKAKGKLGDETGAALIPFDKEDLKDFVDDLFKSRVPRNKEGELLGTSALNWIKNNTDSPVEKQFLIDSGVEKLLQGKKVGREEFQKWMEEKGLPIEIEQKFLDKADRPWDKLAAERARMESLAHWADSQSPTVKDVILRRFNYPYAKLVGTDISIYESLSAGDKAKVEEGVNLAKLLKDAPSERAEWSEITSSPDPKGYTTIAITAKGEVLFPKKHGFPENTLVFGRGRMITRPNGRKVFLLEEGQSDWAQERLKHTPVRVEKISDTRWIVHTKDPESKSKFDVLGAATEAEAFTLAQKWWDKNYPPHPLLDKGEQLLLKEFFKHAKKHNADLAIATYETVGLTEGWDIKQKQAIEAVKEANDLVVRPNDVIGFLEDLKERFSQHGAKFHAEGNKIIIDRLPFEGGGKLHYEQTLPKTARDLSGSEGVIESFGEHKNVRKQHVSAVPNVVVDETGSRIEGYTKPMREDLILRKPDGTLQTDVVARVYPTSGVRKKFSLYGSDKAEKQGLASETAALTLPTKESLLKIRDRIVEELKNSLPVKGAPVPLDLDTKTNVPDLAPREQIKATLAEPFGAERLPIIGRAFSNRVKSRSDIDKEVFTHAAEKGIGESITSTLGAEISGKIDSALAKVIEQGREQGMGVGDTMEAMQKDLSQFKLTAEEKAAFEMAEGILEDAFKLQKKYDLVPDGETGELLPGKPKKDRGVYFPRFVLERPGEAPISGGGKVGAQPQFAKPRIYTTEVEGEAKGVKYEPSVEKRLTTHIGNVYRAIADRRLRSAVSKYATNKARLRASLMEALYEDIENGTVSLKQVEAILSSKTVGGHVWQPAFHRMIFPTDIAKALNKAYPDAPSILRKKLVKANAAIKVLRLGFDFGVPMIQGLTTLFYNPRAWGISTKNAFFALKDNKAFSKYVDLNKEPIRELSQMGSGVGRTPEYLSGAERGEPLERLPVIGVPVRAFARQFQTFLDVAKVELWKSIRETTPKEEWANQVQTLESMLGIGRMESVGLSRNRVQLERVAFLAPSYYRGAANMLAQSITGKGKSGATARRAIGSYMAGGVATFIGIAMAMGMSEDEILARLNPMNVDFLMWDYETEDGRRVNIGLGGIYKSLARLAGKIVKTSLEHPGDWRSLSVQKNPISQWLRAHAGPVPALAFDLFSGKDFLGKDVTLGSAAAGVPPLLAQEVFRDKSQPPVSVGEAVGTTFGLQSFPRSPVSRGAAKILRTQAEQYAKAAEMAKIAFTFGDGQAQIKKLREQLQEVEPTQRGLMWGLSLKMLNQKRGGVNRAENLSEE